MFKMEIDDAKQRYRTIVRSKILQRIYEQTELSEDNNKTTSLEKSNDTTIDQRVQRHLSNEWRKTLERVLNYQEGYYDAQFDIKRKDSLKFFLNYNWKNEFLDESNDGKKRNKKNKKQLKTKPQFDFKVERKKPIKASESSMKLNLIINNFDVIENDSILSKYIDIFGYRCLSRLLHEQINLDNLQLTESQHYKNSFIDRCFVLDKKIGQEDLLCRKSLSKRYNFLNLLTQTWKLFDFIIPNQQYQLNINKRLVLSVGSWRISLKNHPLMNSNDQIRRQLIMAYCEWKKAFSEEMDFKLNQINSQIGMILEKNTTTSKDSELSSIHASKEFEMDINLLERLAEEKQSLVMSRRKKLIKLLRLWDQYISEYTEKEANRKRINLILDEITNINIDEEKKLLENLINLNLQIRKLVSKTHDENNNRKSIYLDDGRLPGEPKFAKIEIILPSSEQLTSTSKSIDNEHKHLNTFFSISIFLGSNIVAEFPKQRLDNSFTLMWDKIWSILFPIPLLNSGYGPIEGKNMPDNESLQTYLPRIEIIEKASGSSKTLCSFTIQNLPGFDINSMDKAINNEQKIYFKTDHSSELVSGTTQFSMFWSSVPNIVLEAIQNSEDNLHSFSSLSDQVILLDQEKRKIKQLTNLNQIEQWLHDIRYLMTIPSNDRDNNRQLQLMHLLFQQKYQIELDELCYQNVKLEKSNKSTEVKNLPDGDFCTDDDIDSNKRFQLMIHRNSGHPNYREYRFMPLTQTDLLLTNVITDITATGDKCATDILINFVKISCEEQEKRIKLNESNTVDVDHSWCFCNTNETNNRNGKFMNQTSWISNAIRVLHNNKSLPNVDPVNGKRSIRTINDMIVEESYDSMSNSSFSLFNFFDGSRKLNPSRKDRSKAAINILNAIDQDVQIVMVVQHASNVPLKMLQHLSSSTDLLSDYEQCSTFIEIKLDNNQTICTSISDGTQPTWNESFKFKIKLDPKQNIYIDLFEVTLSPGRDSASDSHNNLLENESDSIDYHNNLQSMDKFWIGQLKIPLFSLLFNSKIEGSFSLCSPYYLRGYKSVRSNSSSFSQSTTVKNNLADSISQIQSFQMETDSVLDCLSNINLSLFITTDPPIDSSISLAKSSLNGESKEVVEFCNRWKTNLHNQFPNRRYVCLVENLQNKLFLANRFVSELKPPELFDLIKLNEFPFKNRNNSGRKSRNLKSAVRNSSLYVDLLIRFVSLICSGLTCSNQIIKLDSTLVGKWSKASIWCDCWQFLTFRLGYQVEHALLLCSFLRYLHKNAFVATGTCLLSGPTAYVIVYPNNDHDDEEINDPTEAEFYSNKSTKEPVIIIDARRGQKYRIGDYSITLTSIDCIITTDNIYANIQKSSHPNRIGFNLRKSTHWYPLFTKKDLSKFTSSYSTNISIQPRQINYSVTNDDYVKSLEQSLETYLREQFMNWRRLQTGSYTAFNRYCSEIVKQMLPLFECHTNIRFNGFCISARKELEKRLLQQLEEISTIHKIIGYPINVHHCDFEQISRLIHSTGLHNSHHHYGTATAAEYTIAVYVHPYPCNVYSIWIYIASLVPKSTIA